MTFGKVLRELNLVYLVSIWFFMPMPKEKYSSVAVYAVNVIDFTKGFYWVFVL
jgi:hypothetical protein